MYRTDMNVFLRGLFSLLLIGALFAGTVIILFPTSCAKPIAYSIGTLDPRFKLSKEAFLQDIEVAEKMWEKQMGKELFVYDPSSAFTINLTYDDRQAATDKAKKITQSLEKTSQTREGLLQDYADARAAYDVALQLYTTHKAELDASVAAFRTTDEGYNKEGGAPPEEYATLQEQQRVLTNRSNVLEEERVALNALAAQVNKFATTEGKLVQTYNQTVQNFNTEFSNQREFDQGEYTGNAITIYEFLKNNDLVLVLTHELGHALGIGHVQNPAAVMHYNVNEKNLNAKGLTADDISALRAQCNKGSFDIFWERLSTLALFKNMGV